MNLANKLTIFRVILIPFFVLFAFIDIPGTILGLTISKFIILLIFIVAAITDKLDGYIARKYNMITDFGKFLDPLADKLLVNTALILLVGFGQLPSWIAIIIILREFIITGVRLIAVEDGIVIAANIWGKIKTVSQMFAVILMLIDKNNFMACAFEQMGTFDFVLNVLSTLTMTVAVLATVISLVIYLKDNKGVILRRKGI